MAYQRIISDPPLPIGSPDVSLNTRVIGLNPYLVEDPFLSSLDPDALDLNASDEHLTRQESQVVVPDASVASASHSSSHLFFPFLDVPAFSEQLARQESQEALFDPSFTISSDSQSHSFFLSDLAYSQHPPDEPYLNLFPRFSAESPVDLSNTSTYPAFDTQWYNLEESHTPDQSLLQGYSLAEPITPAGARNVSKPSSPLQAYLANFQVNSPFRSAEASAWLPDIPVQEDHEPQADQRALLSRNAVLTEEIAQSPIASWRPQEFSESPAGQDTQFADWWTKNRRASSFIRTRIGKVRYNLAERYATGDHGANPSEEKLLRAAADEYREVHAEIKNRDGENRRRARNRGQQAIEYFRREKHIDIPPSSRERPEEAGQTLGKVVQAARHRMERTGRITKKRAGLNKEIWTRNTRIKIERYILDPDNYQTTDDEDNNKINGALSESPVHPRSQGALSPEEPATIAATWEETGERATVGEAIRIAAEAPSNGAQHIDQDGISRQKIIVMV